MTEISVVIPTYNRMDVLPEVLAALAAQEDAPSFEVIVVDDGSSDGTSEWLARQSFSVPVEVISQQNQGPAAARNRGVQTASGGRVAFLGDDTVPSRGWLATHHRASRSLADRDRVAILGYTGWHPRMRLNPFLEYINEYGLQFGYALIDEPDAVPFNFFYTSNISLPRELLLREPFDLRFPYAAWEDTELSYRLFKHGMRLIYEAEATVAHDHPTTVKRFTQRQEKAGYSAVVFYQLHAELGPFLGLAPEGPPPLPSRWPQWRDEWLARTLQPFSVRMPRLWENVLRYHYIRGLHRGWRDRMRPVEETRHGERPREAGQEIEPQINEP
ncbi:MAG: glycosyltransferase family 2 protein [Acidobacteriota bacterium]